MSVHNTLVQIVMARLLSNETCTNIAVLYDNYIYNEDSGEQRFTTEMSVHYSAGSDSDSGQRRYTANLIVIVNTRALIDMAKRTSTITYNIYTVPPVQGSTRRWPQHMLTENGDPITVNTQLYYEANGGFSHYDSAEKLAHILSTLSGKPVSAEDAKTITLRPSAEADAQLR